jgi:hypothetical protein
MTIALGSAARPAPRVMEQLTAAAAALLVLALLWGAVETRTLDDVPVWLKPAKFAVSFLVTFATLALVQARLSRAWAEGWVIAGTSAVMATAFLAEMAYLIVQAARGEASHFNLSTPFHQTMYSLMGVGAVLLVLGIGVFGLAALLDRGARLSPGLRLAVGLSFLATVVLTLPIAGYMSATGHHVGVAPPGAATIPVLGWSAVVGDLRPAHFLALHGMQAVPLYALWRERNGRVLRGAEAALVSTGWSALTLMVFARALAGLPLIAL